jgi:hypothetical protein
MNDLPLLIDALILVASTAITIQVLGMDLIMRQRFAGSSMSPEQMQKAMEQGTSPIAVYITCVAVTIGVPIAMLIGSGVLTVFGMMTSRTPKFGSMLAMVNIAFTSLDLLGFMEIGLLSYGFSKLTKAGIALSIAAVGSLWILYVMLKMARSLFQ